MAVHSNTSTTEYKLLSGQQLSQGPAAHLLWIAVQWDQRQLMILVDVIIVAEVAPPVLLIEGR